MNRFEKLICEQAVKILRRENPNAQNDVDIFLTDLPKIERAIGFHAQNEQPGVDILDIDFDGFELILRKINPSNKVELVDLTFGLTIFIAALETPQGGTPSLLPVASIANATAVDNLGNSVTVTPGTTGASTTVTSAGGGTVTVSSSSAELQLGPAGAGATSVIVTADITDSNGVTDTGKTITVPLPVPAEGTELVAFNAP